MPAVIRRANIGDTVYLRSDPLIEPPFGRKI